jgi:hypothetical protein
MDGNKKKKMTKGIDAPPVRLGMGYNRGAAPAA